MAFEEIFLIVGIAGVLVAVFLPFVLRGLNKGEKQVITTNNYYNLQANVTSIEKRLEKYHEERKQEDENLSNEHRKDMNEVNKAFAEIGGNMKVHTGQIANFCIDIAKLEDRLRIAEGNIIRNERMIRSNGNDK